MSEETVSLARLHIQARKAEEAAAAAFEVSELADRKCAKTMAVFEAAKAESEAAFATYKVADDAMSEAWHRWIEHLNSLAMQYTVSSTNGLLYNRDASDAGRQA